MEFLKKHYEKILLALVLLGLMGAVVYMLIFIPGERKRMGDLQNVRLNPPVTPLAKWKPDLFDLGAEQKVLQRADAPFQLDFTTGHNLFNPVLWRLKPGGRLEKIQTGNEIGPGALVVTDINPIYLNVTAAAANNGYLITVYREVPGISRHVDEKTSIVSKDSKSDVAILKDVAGPDENPQLTLELKETHETIPVGYDKPFRRVDGYTANLKYPPDPNARPWLNLRPGQGRASMLRIEDANYFLIEVADDHVVVLSEANKKKTTIPFNPAK